MFKKAMLASALMCSFALPSVATAGAEGAGKLGVGFQSSWPSYGLSAKYDLNEDITVQATLGALGTVTNFGGRVMYRFKKEPKYDLYGFGSVGVYKWSNSFYNESHTGFGAGGGIEFDLSKDLNAPITISGEAGFASVGFDHYGGFSSFGLGIGAHYWIK